MDYKLLYFKNESWYNEPAISPPIYFESVKKWKYGFRKEKKNEKDQKQTEKKKIPMARDETRTSEVEGQRPLSIAPGQLTLKTRVKLIIHTTFAHEILPVDAVWSL